MGELIERIRNVVTTNDNNCIANYQDISGILAAHHQYATPYRGRVKQADQRYGFFPGLLLLGKALSPDHSDHSDNATPTATTLLHEHDISERLPLLVASATDHFPQDAQHSIEWHEMAQFISAKVVAGIFGMVPTQALAGSCKRLYDWLFADEFVNFDCLSEQHRKNILNDLADLRQSMLTAIQTSDSSAPAESSTIVARAAGLQRQLELTDEDTADMLMGFLVGVYPPLLRSFEAAMALLDNNKLLPKIYQAASVGDTTAIENMLADSKPIQTLNVIRKFARIALEDHEFTGKQHSFSVTTNETVYLQLTKSDFKRHGYPKPLGYEPKNPIGNYLLYGMEPHISFGHTLAIKIVAASLAELFSRHRIKHCAAPMLTLEPLPGNPAAYHFTILGSSPPWGAGEEQAWLLDACGIKQHTQYNILSVKEFLRLLIMQSTKFYDKSLFYVGYDKKHSISFGSPYGGVVDATIKMGDNFHNFCGKLGLNGARPASDFTADTHYQAVLTAYSTIRHHYYTWAYFSAFLDGASRFLLDALLLFTQKNKFKGAGFIGEILLAAALRLVILLLKLPIIGPRFGNYLQATVDNNLIQIKEGIAALDQVLADGRRYIFGDDFSAADIYICATMANLIIPEEFQGGNIQPPLKDYPPTYKKQVEEFRQTVTGQYVLRVYREHRIAGDS